MCKIVTFTNSEKLDVFDVANKIGNILLKTETDGFGYAVQGESGVFGEKCVDDIFESRFQLPKSKNPSKVILEKYKSFGRFSKPSGPMLLHGRTSTNYLGLRNCHPMIKKDHYLIHNGVVTDHGPKYKHKTDTDSEDVLHRFIESIESVQKNLTGYYAFTCISPDGKLHVVRDNIATLHMAWMPDLNTYIIATKRELIMKIAKELNTPINAIDEIKPDIYLVFNGNDLESHVAIKSRGWGDREARHASKSLGRELHNWKDYDSEAYELFTDSEALDDDEFNEAIAFVDDTYMIFDKDDNQIDAAEFHSLDLISKKQCWIRNEDGYEFTSWENVG